MVVFFKASSSRLESDEDVLCASCFNSSKNPNVGCPPDEGVVAVELFSLDDPKDMFHVASFMMSHLLAADASMSLIF